MKFTMPDPPHQPGDRVVHATHGGGELVGYIENGKCIVRFDRDGMPARVSTALVSREQVAS